MSKVKWVIEFIISFFSTMGFGIITNIPKRALLPACLTGAIAWSTYYLLSGEEGGLVFPNFVAALIIGILGNIFAVIQRVPVNTIYTPSLVSLVPGSIIYLGMKNFTVGNERSGKYDLFNVVVVAMALAVGFVCAEVIYQMIHPFYKKQVTKWSNNHVS